MQPRYFRVLLMITACLILTGGIFGTLLYIHSHSVKPIAPQSTPVDANATSISKQALLNAVNAERAKNGAPPLQEDPRLDASAQEKADDETNHHYFGHIDSDGQQGYTLAEKSLANIPGHFSENITEPTPITTNQAMQNWDISKPHHDAIVDPRYTLTGFGISSNNIVEHFYSPQDF